MKTRPGTTTGCCESSGRISTIDATPAGNANVNAPVASGLWSSDVGWLQSRSRRPQVRATMPAVTGWWASASTTGILTWTVVEDMTGAGTRPRHAHRDVQICCTHLEALNAPCREVQSSSTTHCASLGSRRREHPDVPTTAIATTRMPAGAFEEAATCKRTKARTVKARSAR